jgi:hypothetical protein
LGALTVHEVEELEQLLIILVPQIVEELLSHLTR